MVTITSLSTYSYSASIVEDFYYTQNKSLTLTVTELGGQEGDAFTRAKPIGDISVGGFTAGDSTKLSLTLNRNYSSNYSFSLGVSSSTPDTKSNPLTINHYWFALDWVIFEKSKFY